MKERPILFNGAMVRAILDGAKTQTRRVARGVFAVHSRTGEPLAKLDSADPRVPCPYGLPGDRLWVRETFQPLFADGIESRSETDWETGKGYAVAYPATDGIQEFLDPDDNLTDACKPSIHMPRWASRITLEITGARVERLQDITEADAEAEGIDFLRHIPDVDDSLSARQFFECLWESINGPGSWDENPWVWVIEFQRIAQGELP